MKLLFTLLLATLAACTATSSTRPLSPDREQGEPRHLPPDSTRRPG